ncbi:MAG: phosphoribosylaminoimidazolesuccinocarboxamide synthase [Isosphaeraceae bacterium]
MTAAFLETTFEALRGLPRRKGKVRDVFDLGSERLLIVASDRISAFDWVLPTGIPDKGRVLTSLSAFWFGLLDVPNHLISLDPRDITVAGEHLDLDPEELDALTGRTMIVHKARVVPFECVARGYLSGSGWKEYQATGTVCGLSLPPGLVESDRLDPPIFTPATKAESGHDLNVSYETMVAAVGAGEAATLRAATLDVYNQAARHARDHGLILADTKLEWGFDDRSGELLLVDEVLTPDSSRFWSAESYRPGGAQPSFDKQYVRDWLETTGWDKASPPPALPEDVVARTRAKYIDAYEALTGQAFAWK